MKTYVYISTKNLKLCRIFELSTRQRSITALKVSKVNDNSQLHTGWAYICTIEAKNSIFEHLYGMKSDRCSMGDETLYSRLGGQEVIRAVVDDFYDRLLADDELGPFFEDANMEMLRQTQTDFLCEAAGGPEIYDAAPVREAHLHIPFTAGHIQRAVELLYESLAEYDVPDEDAEKIVQEIAAYEEDLLARPDGEP